MTEGRPPTVGSAPLWERDAEIATVAQALDVLCADQSSGGSLLVLRGEAGLGKTALLAETRRIAERRGCTVWSARGAETLKSVPFHVVRQLLQPALLSLLPEEAREYLGDWYDIAGPALGIADPQGDKADPQYVCDGLVAAVRRLSRRQWPLVLLLDDAHWADQETLRWLAAFAERLDDLSVLVVVARRPGEAGGESARLLDAVAAAAGRPSTPSAPSPRTPPPDSPAPPSAGTPTTRSAARSGPSPAATPTTPSNSSPRCRTPNSSRSRRGPENCARSTARPAAADWSTGSRASAWRPPGSPGPPPSSAPASPSTWSPASPP
ncbi:hypothetical protein GCM10010206_53380 [Streptomyces cinerochromogenes]|nr:hypothetical protein GCM10010206_53380 [Streptomyces cinerochromogenes]